MISFPDTIEADFSDRNTPEALHPLLARRWSPRAFVKTPISDEAVKLLFEAARWAPSCYNEQPWKFWVSTEQSFDDFLKLLLPANQSWARHASLLCFIGFKQNFKQNGHVNAWAAYDSGAAAMSVKVQARAMGLYTHSMGGFDSEAAHKYLGLKADQTVITAMAIGVATDASTLPEQLAIIEKPNQRKRLPSILQRV